MDKAALLREVNEEIRKENRKKSLSVHVPSIFITEGDAPDTYAVSIGKKWSKDKSPREILPILMRYKNALAKELRSAEYYIKYLKDGGLYPLGDFRITIDFMEKER